MVSLNPLRFEKAVLLAPMENVTDLSYRLICKEMGAEMVYTEFVNSDGLIRGCKQGKRKMKIVDEERPVGIQIYGNDVSSMVGAAILAEQFCPDILDINAGCWVKKVSTRGAGAGLLKDPIFMQKMIKEVVDAVSIPVTVKTRIGWCADSINIVEVAQRLEDVGVQAMTVHCRTRSQGHRGDPDWDWIGKIKEKVSFPIVLNGGLMSAEDVKRAFDNTPADGVMIARGAIGCPWIFSQIHEFLQNPAGISEIFLAKKIDICLRHLRRFVDLKGESRAVLSFRRHYKGYLKGYHHSDKLRVSLMHCVSYKDVESRLLDFLHSKIWEKGSNLCSTV